MSVKTIDQTVLVATPHMLPPLVVGGVTAGLRRPVAIIGDMLLAVAIVFSIPFVILVVGIPLALFVQLLLSIARLF